MARCRVFAADLVRRPCSFNLFQTCRFNGTVENGYCDFLGTREKFVAISVFYSVKQSHYQILIGQNSHKIPFLSQGDSHNIRFLLYVVYMQYVVAYESHPST